MKVSLSRTLLATALVVAAMPGLAQTRAPFTQTYFFGDSLTDAGFFRPTLPLSVQTVTGQFTTNPGQVWAQFLADYYGTDGSTAWSLTPTGIAAGTGTNFAAGGARVATVGGFPPQQPTINAPSLSAQIAAHLARNGGRADPNALYTVWGGANDLFYHLNGLTTQGTFLASAGQQVSLVATLNTAGARYILVPTMPDVGKTPFGLSQGAAGSDGITQLAAAYNQTLFGGLASANLRVIPLDIFKFIREISASPSIYGLSNVKDTACVGVPSSLICNPSSLVNVTAPLTYAFADGVHPTTGAHKLIAEFAMSVIEGPRQIAVLPQSAATIGRGRAEMLATGLATRPDGDGMGWWASFRNDNQRIGRSGTGEAHDGDAPSLSAGVQWSAGNLTYGAFGGYGRADIDWAERRGNFRQTDASVGGFIGWVGPGPWANAQVSYTWLDFDVQRDIVLGPAARTHYGSADGTNLTAAASAGWTFNHGRLGHGPVLGLVSQRIDVDGFAETDPGLSTSLAYADQSQDSRVGSAGWQASFALDEHVVPYARLAWEREFEDPADEVFASAQSMPGTLAYAVPGLAMDREYGTAHFGVRAGISGLDVLAGTRITVNQDDARHVAFFVTVGRKF